MQRVPLAIDWPALISSGGYSDEPCVKCRCKKMSLNSCAVCLNAVFTQGIVGILSVFCIYQYMHINQPSIDLSLWSFINPSSHLWVCPSIHHHVHHQPSINSVIQSCVHSLFHPSVHPFLVHPSNHAFVSICFSFYSSIHPSIHIDGLYFL